MNTMYLARQLQSKGVSSTETGAGNTTNTNPNNVQHLINESHCILGQSNPRCQELSITIPYSRSWSVVSTFFSNRRIFGTKLGTYGIGPHVVRPRHQLCVLLGAKVPFLLKATEDDKFMLLGEAFVDSEEVVSGKAMELGKVGEVRDFILI